MKINFKDAYLKHQERMGLVIVTDEPLDDRNTNLIEGVVSNGVFYLIDGQRPEGLKYYYYAGLNGDRKITIYADRLLISGKTLYGYRHHKSLGDGYTFEYHPSVKSNKSNVYLTCRGRKRRCLRTLELQNTWYTRRY